MATLAVPAGQAACLPGSHGTCAHLNPCGGTWITCEPLRDLSKSGTRMGPQSGSVCGPRPFPNCQALPIPCPGLELLIVAARLTCSISPRHQTWRPLRVLSARIFRWSQSEDATPTQCAALDDSGVIVTCDAEGALERIGVGLVRVQPKSVIQGPLAKPVSCEQNRLLARKNTGRPAGRPVRLRLSDCTARA